MLQYNIFHLNMGTQKATSYNFQLHTSSSFCKIAFFKPQHSLENSARLHPIFTSLNIRTIIFLETKVISLAFTLELEDQVFVYRSSSDRMAQLYPQARGSHFVAFYSSQGCGGDILTSLHTGFELDMSQ
jgi:hypothetical protein